MQIHRSMYCYTTWNINLKSTWNFKLISSSSLQSIWMISFSSNKWIQLKLPFSFKLHSKSVWYFKQTFETKLCYFHGMVRYVSSVDNISSADLIFSYLIPSHSICIYVLVSVHLIVYVFIIHANIIREFDWTLHDNFEL